MKTRRPLAPLLLASLGLMCLSGCFTDESLFTDGRLEDLCNGSIPVCETQAACVLDVDEFYRSEFPGGARMIVRTEAEQSTLIVRFLLTETLYPGTELLVQAYEPGCGELDERHLQDINLFEFAGDDRILEFELELPGRGDHLLEIYSDMSAQYLMTVLVNEELP